MGNGVEMIRKAEPFKSNRLLRNKIGNGDGVITKWGLFQKYKFTSIVTSKSKEYDIQPGLVPFYCDEKGRQLLYTDFFGLLTLDMEQIKEPFINYNGYVYKVVDNEFKYNPETHWYNGLLNCNKYFYVPFVECSLRNDGTINPTLNYDNIIKFEKSGRMVVLNKCNLSYNVIDDEDECDMDIWYITFMYGKEPLQKVYAKGEQPSYLGLFDSMYVERSQKKGETNDETATFRVPIF